MTTHSVIEINDEFVKVEKATPYSTAYVRAVRLASRKANLDWDAQIELNETGEATSPTGEFVQIWECECSTPHFHTA